MHTYSTLMKDRAENGFLNKGGSVWSVQNFDAVLSSTVATLTYMPYVLPQIQKDGHKEDSYIITHKP